jgi:hypothetical protein
MILRRFMKHITDQNWFAVGLDVLVVIVGIFLGLQVQAWYGRQAESIEERNYLFRLSEEFSEAIVSNNSVAAYMDQLETNSNLMIESLSVCELAIEDRDKFATGLYTIGKAQPPVLTHGVIDELISSGKFQLIGNVTVRKALLKYMQNRENVAYINRNLVERMYPHIVFVEKQLLFKDTIGNRGIDPITWGQLEIDFPILCKTEGIVNAIALIQTYNSILRTRIDEAIVLQSELINLIENELE